MDDIRARLDALRAGNPLASKYIPVDEPVDFSSELVPPKAYPQAEKGDFIDEPVDFSSELVAPTSSGSSFNRAVGDYTREFGKGAAHGATSAVGSAVQGIDSVGSRPSTMEGIAGAASRLSPFNLIDKALKGVGLIDETGADAMQRMRDEARPEPRSDVTAGPFYKAGQDVKSFADEQFPAAPGWEDSLTRKVSGALGSTVPLVGVSMLPGGVGLGMTAGSLMSSAEAVDRAVEAGATKEQIAEAGRQGRLVGLTEQFPIEVILERVPLPAAGKAISALGRVIAKALAEGGQEGVQQTLQNLIEKGVYNPAQDIWEGTAENAVLGTVVGGGMGVVGEAATPRPGEPAQPGQPAPARAEPTFGLDGEVLPPEPAPPAGPGLDAPGPTIIDGEVVPPLVDRSVGSSGLVAETPAQPANAPVAQGPLGLPDPSLDGEILPPAARQALAGLLDRPQIDGEVNQPAPAAPDETTALPAPTLSDNALQLPATSPQGLPAPPAQIAQPIASDNQETLSIAGPASVEANAAPLVDEPLDLSDELIAPVGLGTRSKPLMLSGPAALEAANQRAAQPTVGQAKANNYKQGHVRFPRKSPYAGMVVAIETPKGAVRRDKQNDTPQWEVTLPATYGRIQNTVGGDKQPVDVYIGDNLDSPSAFVIDQVDPDTGRWDEHKVVVGANSRQEAEAIYDGGFQDGSGPMRRAAVSEIPAGNLKAWATSGKARRPFDRNAVAEFRRNREAMKPKIGMDPERMMAKFPILKSLAAEGGVDPRSPLAGELRNMGVTESFVKKNSSLRGLYQPGGRTAVDNFPASEWGDYFPELQGQEDDHNGYVPPESMLGAIRDETFGAPRRTPAEQEKIDAYREAMDDARRRHTDAELQEVINDAPWDIGDELRSDAWTDSDTESYLASQEVSADGGDRYTGQEAGFDGDQPEVREGREDEIEPGAYEPDEEETRSPPPTSSWMEEREARIKASRAAGNQHLDQAQAAVETMRGHEIFSVHDPKERGKIRTVSNDGDVVVHWADSYSAQKNLAQEKTEKRGRQTVTVHESWLMPSDLKDYVFARGSVEVEAGADGKAQTVIPGAEKIGDGKLAQMKADTPLRPQADQKPMDAGLFGDSAAQTDLMDLVRKPEAGPPVEIIETAEQVVEEPRVEATRKPERLEDAGAKIGGARKDRWRERGLTLDDLDGMTAVHGTAGGVFTKETGYKGDPYPNAEERAAINAAFDELVDAMKVDESVDPPVVYSARRGAAPSRAKLETEIEAIVRQVAPDSVALELHDSMTVDGSNPGLKAWNLRGPQKIAGSYSYIHDLIRVAMDMDPVNTAFHESWHSIERLMTKAERALFAREMPRLRSIADRDLADGAADISKGEVLAVAFAAYSEARYKGMHVGVRRFFDKLARIIRKVRNLLQGYSFNTAEDVFDAAYAGEIKGRAGESAAKSEALSARRRPTAAQQQASGAAFVAPEPSKARDFRFKWQDRFIDMREYQRAIEKQIGAALAPDQDVYRFEELYPGKTGARLNKVRRDHVQPIIKYMKQHKISYKEIGEFLMARHALERNAHLRKMGSTKADPSGMSDADAMAIVRKHRAANRLANFNSLGKRVDKLIAETRDGLLRDGLITPEQHKDWGSTYNYYVPLRGFETDPEHDEGNPMGTGKGFDIGGPEAKAAMGRGSKSDNPLLYVILQAETGAIRGEKNRVLRALVRLVKANPNKDVWEIDQHEIRSRRNPTTGLIETYHVGPQALNDANTFRVKIGGKTQFITLKDDRLARDMKQLGAEGLTGVLNFSAGINRFLSKANTSWNPAFSIPNFFRDLQAGMLHMSEFKVRGLRTKVLRDLPAATRGMWRYTRDKDTSTGWAKYAQEFADAGGKIEFYNMDNVRDQQKKLERKLKGSARDKALAVVEAFEDANGAVENAIRLALFVNLRRAGKSKADAASAARNLTVNFNRRGANAPTVNALYMFFNAAVQGSVRLGQAIKRSPVKMGAALGAMVALGAVEDMLNYALAGEDDDDMNRWDKVPTWEKERNLILMWPGSDVGYKIPLSYGYNVAVVLGMELSAVARHSLGMGQGSSVAEATAKMMSSFMGSFMPIDDGGSALQWAAPTVADPFLQIAENTDWAGKPVHRQSFDEKDPKAYLYNRGASPWMKAAAEAANKATGGNEFRKGAIDVSPDDLDHLAAFFTGGAGDFWINKVIGSGWKLATGEEIQSYQVPLVSKVRTEVSSMTDSGVYYDLRDEVQTVEQEIKGFRKIGEPEKAKAAAEARPVETKAIKAFSGAEKQLAKLRKVVKAIDADKDLTSAQKQAKIKVVRERQDAIMRQARKVWEQAREGEVATAPAL